ncbi:hypothetical protein ATW55_05795 [Ferroacidibacillus organovorans]|uniref:Heme chaperone HemW n=1 Tax=Ferroacidibacillus organovorans TaxID=1765683 RepID=A0A117SYT8_9BACL|nr:hypothetical protein ATW55_05795 [Ferroacidibacillus organovorans]
MPFCASKCFYCDFNSYVASESVRAQYVDDLVGELKELKRWYSPNHSAKPLQTIYIGGGTPTMLSAREFERIAMTIHETFERSADLEWTVEANPGTTTPEILRAMKEMGVNRVSIGTQTFNETLLLSIGRLHSPEQTRASVEQAFAAGIDRVSLDLMLGLPDQTLDDVDDALTQVLAAGVSHVSAYGLKVEENTPFFSWEKKGLLHLPDEDLQVAMYERVRERLLDAGFLHYEVSNYARPGAESRHNLTYWRNRPYFAAGAGAHGYTGKMRYENIRALGAYHEARLRSERPVENEYPVSRQEAMENEMMLGLRLAEGVSDRDFFARYQTSIEQVFKGVCERLLKLGLLTHRDGIWRVPEQHVEVANEIYAEFVGVHT